MWLLINRVLFLLVISKVRTTCSYKELVYPKQSGKPSSKGKGMLCCAKSLQSCPTLCDPRDGSPPGSPVPGILQARTLEWVVISFSNAWKWKVKVKSLSRVRLLATQWTAAYQAPPSMGFSRQEHWKGVPLPSLNMLLNILTTTGSGQRNSLRWLCFLDDSVPKGKSLLVIKALNVLLWDRLSQQKY